MIGDWIKAQRKARGWTQAQLAEVSGISLAYLHHLELNHRPHPRPATVSRLAAAFGVTMEGVRQEAGLRSPLPAEEQPGLQLEEWVQEMVRLGPTLSPAARATLLQAARAMGKADLQ